VTSASFRSAPPAKRQQWRPRVRSIGARHRIAVAKLDALKLAAVTGEVPQNVNFALKADYLRSFLNVSGVQLPDDDSIREVRKSEELAANAKAISLNVECRPDTGKR